MPFIHHNYRICPELENSRLSNHCPLSQTLRSGPGTPDLSRNSVGAWNYTVEDRGRLGLQVCAPPRHPLLSSSKESAGRPARACRRPGAQQGRVPATVRPPGRPGAARAQYSRSLWGMEPPVHPIPPKRTRHSLQECPPLGKSPLGHLSASVPDQSCLPRPPPRRCRPRPPPAPPPSSCSGSPPPPPAPPRPRRRQRDRARFHT